MKSPGGSVFPYYYKGGEIHCLKYGNQYKNEASLFRLMQEEEQFILQTNRRLKVWVDFYKTAVTKRVLVKFTENIAKLTTHIDKLSVVGLSRFNRWRLKRLSREAGLNLKIAFYADPEEAKTWLISERI